MLYSCSALSKSLVACMCMSLQLQNSMAICSVSWRSFMASCFCILLSFNFYVASSKCLEDQKSLLLQLKNSLSFTKLNSIKLVTWDQSLSCSDWSGVTCDEQGHVIGLDLSGESIFGGFNSSSSIFNLQFLEVLSLAFNNFNSEIPSEFYKLKNLTHLDLSYAGFMGQIPEGISQLTRLVILYISGPKLKLENLNLRMLVQNLTSIRKLYLDGVLVSEQGPEWGNALSLLPNLQELSLADCNLTGPIDSSLSKLKFLSVINFGRNNLSAPAPDFIGDFSNLKSLCLSSCQLNESFPQIIFQIKTLTSIDISYNYDLSGSFPDFPVNGSLQILKVSHTNFSGGLPDSIGILRNLSELDISTSQFSGLLPNSISNLRELNYVDLSSNTLRGPIPSFLTAKELFHVDLSNNFFNGSVPSSLFMLPSLQTIQLSNNQFSQLDEFPNVTSSVLEILDLSGNKISGPIPKSISQLRALSVLLLFSNKFNGSMLFEILVELRNLTLLDLSYNNLSIKLNTTDSIISSIPNMTTVKLAGCKLEAFPSFLRHQSKLIGLDLSDNQLQGLIPNWVWKLESLKSLNLSHNLLTAFERSLQNLSISLVLLDLHENYIQGPIPFIPAYYLDYSNNHFNSFLIPDNISNYLHFTFFLSLSNNSFQGNIPKFFCNFTSLEVLDLSLNNFSGTIPSCLVAMSETFGVLTLRKNNLTGKIPDTFPDLCVLRTLDLNENLLDGPMPKSLANCKALEVLDLGNNHFIDGFPCLLKKIPTLRVLVLRKNKFHGSIRCPNTTGDIWHMLQIADLAFNNFTGKLALKSFTSWEGVVPDEAQTLQFDAGFQNYYHDTVSISSKGQRVTWVKILTIFTAIDFSSNFLEGPIPEELMNFKALYILNLSNNALTGHIPSSIGNMRNLESLDLSNNSLTGEIPAQMADLSFLSYLNLSYNHLVGRIPSGTQIQSFQSYSFIGNDGLCGPPLTPNCSSNELPSQSKASHSKSPIDWNFISAEVGFVFGIAAILFPLIFWKTWRTRYWKHIDDLLYRVFPQLDFVHECRGGKHYRTLKWKSH